MISNAGENGAGWAGWAGALTHTLSDVYTRRKHQSKKKFMALEKHTQPLSSIYISN